MTVCWAKRSWDSGIFDNGMAWASLERKHSDDAVASKQLKTIINIPGGPGNPAPSTGWGGKVEMGLLLPLLEKGTGFGKIITIARKRNMPLGHTVADVAKDYADCIAENVEEGKADLIVGVSYGGMIGQYLAANHADCFEHIVIVVAAYAVEPKGAAIDYAFAQKMSEGKPFAAGKEISKAIFPTWPSFLAGLTGGIMMKMMYGTHAPHEYAASDVMVEAEAEKAMDARDVLLKIKVPVLLIAGEKDAYFPVEYTNETVELIPDCTLKMYEGKGHLDVAMDKQRVSADILEFIKAHEAKS